mmetsp:Transcript_32565/g.52900  ORF Transcript_32565/g.52900 Transcript_32565/m.52900 type:complete len:431 (+) Transcript_32565:62-1354(+)
MMMMTMASNTQHAVAVNCSRSNLFSESVTSSSGEWGCLKCSFSMNQNHQQFCGMCGAIKGMAEGGQMESEPEPLKQADSKKMEWMKSNILDQVAVLPSDVTSKIKAKLCPSTDIYKGVVDTTKRLALSSQHMGSIVSKFSADASIIDYDTIKDKENPKQLHYGFAPKAHSQWHWFFVAKKTMKPTLDLNGKNKGSYTFRIDLDKFRIAQGKCDPSPKPDNAHRQPEDRGKPNFLNSSNKFSYGCTGAKMFKTETKKKKVLLRMCLDDNEFERQQRIELAREHNIQLRHQKGKTKIFVEKDGKQSPYFGMPIGGVHNWNYRDAQFNEFAMKTGRACQWQAKDVEWREMKVHKDRWALSVTGTLHLPKGMATTVKLEQQESLVIADQIATKLSPNSYHVALRGVKVPLMGGNSYQREENRREILSKIVESFA